MGFLVVLSGRQALTFLEKPEESVCWSRFIGNVGVPLAYTYQTTWHHIPGDHYLHIHLPNNVTFYKLICSQHNDSLLQEKRTNMVHTVLQNREFIMSPTSFLSSVFCWVSPPSSSLMIMVILCGAWYTSCCLCCPSAASPSSWLPFKR